MNDNIEEREANLVAQIGHRFEHFLETHRCPDGSRWGEQDLHNATGDVVTCSWVNI